MRRRTLAVFIMDTSARLTLDLDAVTSVSRGIHRIRSFFTKALAAGLTGVTGIMPSHGNITLTA